jgi:hypothetical protein
LISNLKRLVFGAGLFVATVASARNLYIPVAGVAPGLNNTRFRTDVRLFNPSHVHDIDVSVHFLPQGQDNSNMPGRTVRVPRRQMVVLNNVVENFMQFPAPIIGALRLDSDTDRDYALIADSRTYTDSPNPSAPGTYGQFIPALDVTTALKKSIVLHAANNAVFRTNAGAMNPQRVPATVTFSLVLPDGTLAIPENSITIPPMSTILVSLPAMFGPVRAFDDAFLHVDSTEPVFSFISVIDNQSGDQFFVTGAEDKSEVKPLPGPGL